MIRAVIDTNVLVSGLLSPAGNEATILLAIRQKFLSPCFSEAIMAEYAVVIARPKFRSRRTRSPPRWRCCATVVN